MSFMYFEVYASSNVITLVFQEQLRTSRQQVIRLGVAGLVHYQAQINPATVPVMTVDELSVEEEKDVGCDEHD